MKILVYINKNFTNINSDISKNKNSIETVVAAANKLVELFCQSNSSDINNNKKTIETGDISINEGADKNNCEITAFIPNGSIEDFEFLSNYGISNIINLVGSNEPNAPVSSELNFFNIVDNLKNIIDKYKYDIVLFPNTIFCSEVAPYISIKSNSAYISNIINFELDEYKNLIASKYKCSGNLITKLQAKTPLKIFTVNLNSFESTFAKKEYTVLEEKINVTNNQNKYIHELLKFEETTTELTITEAKVVVSVGRGVGESHNINLIKEFADILSAGIASSRALVDSGIMSHSTQVGQTGKIIAPDVYIACGISGAPQHIMGINKSKYIIAINKDKHAPIFTISDVMVVGDMFKILPKLIERLIF